MPTCFAHSRKGRRSAGAAASCAVTSAILGCEDVGSLRPLPGISVNSSRSTLARRLKWSSAADPAGASARRKIISRIIREIEECAAALRHVRCAGFHEQIRQPGIRGRVVAVRYAARGSRPRMSAARSPTHQRPCR